MNEDAARRISGDEEAEIGFEAAIASASSCVRQSSVSSPYSRFDDGSVRSE